MCVRACAYGQLTFLSYKALNTVGFFGFTDNDFHVNKCNKSSVCVLRMLFFGI